MQSLKKLETDVRLIRFRDDLEEVWDEFVYTKAKNATFLHSRKFYNHNDLNKTDDCSLLFFKKNKIIALFPAILSEADNNKVLYSHQRSTYGGFVFSNDISIADLDLIITLLIDYAKAESIKQIIIRPTFSIYHKTLSQEVDFLLWKNGFSIKSRELELAIDLGLDTENLYTDSAKRSIKKAAKAGVMVQESADMEGYWKVLEKNLAEKYGKAPVHSIQEIINLGTLVGKEKIRLFTATLNENIIAGILTFVANERVLHAQYIASDNHFQDFRPLNAVIDHIAKKAKEEGFSYFNLGMVTEPGGEELNEGLCRFKEGFGARGVLRETMQLILKP